MDFNEQVGFTEYLIKVNAAAFTYKEVCPSSFQTVLKPLNIQ
jgi:hypothetical protein